MPNDLKLAITTIGDLLLENRITQDKDGNTITNVKLEIPPYQRPYKWTTKNVNQLLNDILEAKNAKKETYRVGTLILHQDLDIIKNPYSKYEIVDGQQRIITFSLLLKVLNNALPVGFLGQSLADNPINRQNIPTNFRALEMQIRNITDDKDELLEFIKKRCELIVVITHDISEAFQFFDSQNARGKKLYPHDLLKAYHLREMNDLDVTETEKVVKIWEDFKQKDLSDLFSNYLFRVKEWIKGDRAEELTENNIHIFKGITRRDNYPYAQFYKGAYAYSDTVNHSAMPFVSGIRNIKSFQLDAPIIAGKPFFDYAKHYFEILKDIQNNDKYEGYYMNDNAIVKTLDLGKYKNGTGNGITRLLFDTAILLYVDRFCPERPTKEDLIMLDRFLILTFIWAYSLRAQYTNLGLASAQNYIMGNIKYINSFNIYKIITESDSPISLLSTLSGDVKPLPNNRIKADKKNIDETNKKDEEGEKDEKVVFQNYLHWFKEHKFMEDGNGN